MNMTVVNSLCEAATPLSSSAEAEYAILDAKLGEMIEQVQTDYLSGHDPEANAIFRFSPELAVAMHALRARVSPRCPFALCICGVPVLVDVTLQHLEWQLESDGRRYRRLARLGLDTYASVKR